MRTSPPSPFSSHTLTHGSKEGKKEKEIPTSFPNQLEKEETGTLHFSSPAMERKKALDLFCGSGSVAKRLLELGYDVISLDINPRFKPTRVSDIFRWNYRKQFQPGYFELVTASPPCEQYSQARTTKGRDYDYADQCVRKVLEIVQYFHPPLAD